MSERPKQPYRDMIRVAELLVDRLSPACERIEIAGSLRRQRPMCSDIELIAIPKPILNLIGEPSGTTEVDLLLDKWPIYIIKRGRKYVQFWFDGSQMPFWVDLFLQPDPATWGWNYMIRTGSMEFSKKMVLPQRHGGYKPEWATVEGARVWREGKALDTREEGMVFDLWQLDWIEPRDRA